MEKQRNDVVSGIRACLISTKGKLPLRQLDNDYGTLIGERIPYRQFGFKRLEEFIQSEPSLVVTRSNGEIFVDAAISGKSAHISEMVYKQKPAKRKLIRRAPPRFSGYVHNIQKNWRPNHASTNKRFYSSPRPRMVSHNQFVNRPSYNPPSVPSKIIIPETSGLHKKRNDISSRLSVTFNVKEQQVQNRSVTDKQSTIQKKNIEDNPPPRVNSSSPLTSTRRRITKKMADLNLERDSGHSSPTSEVSIFSAIAPTMNAITPTLPTVTPILPAVTPTLPAVKPTLPVVTPTLPAVTPTLPVVTPISPAVTRTLPAVKPVVEERKFVPTGDYIEDLKNFTAFHNIELDVSVKKVKTKQNQFHCCKIKVGKNAFNSYPNEFNAIEAQIYCSKEALEQLMKEYGGSKKMLLLASNKDILERVPPMLEKHNHGIWDWQLQLDYADIYNEQLPSDWLKIIDSSPCIQLEKCLDNYVLRHCKPGDVLQKAQKWNTFMSLTDVSVPSNTVKFNEDNMLYAIVFCAMKANEVWCRQCNTDESEEFNNTMVRMEEHFNSYGSQLKADIITKDSYYVTNYDGIWLRVRAVEVMDTHVKCFLIDYGDETDLPKTDLYKLPREFAVAQAQAFVCRLAGLEDLYKSSENSKIIQTILDQEVILELATHVAVVEDDPCLPVYMYDNKTGKSLNEELIPKLTLESANPEIQKDSIEEHYVSNIEKNGDIYVQRHSPGFLNLQNLLFELETQVLQEPPMQHVRPVTKENSEGVLYFGRFNADDHWYRIKIIDWAPKGKLAQIYFVDYGNTNVINVDDEVLYPLDELSDVLSLYPHQAVKVRMAIDEIPSNFVYLAQKTMPENQPVLLKFVKNDENGVPLVEFFKRNSDGGLFCINKSIMMEAEIKRGDTNNNSKSSFKSLVLEGKNVPSGGQLECPRLPSKGSYFQVCVPFAVNPYNFFVQPLESQKQLNRMMQEIQNRYRDVQYSPLNVGDIVPGNIYASKFDDGNWYRTTVIKVIHAGSISVFYCDFGYYANLTVQQLIPLDIEFMHMPYQALKAKLADVKPTQSKWTMDDCDDFKRMVEKKYFYSILMALEKDELYRSDIVLNLILIDTSSPEDDVCIGQELIRKGKAIEI